LAICFHVIPPDGESKATGSNGKGYYVIRSCLLLPAQYVAFFTGSITVIINEAMKGAGYMILFLKSILELFGVVYLRFRPLPRVWCVWLVAVNAACLFFIHHIEAQVVLAVTCVAVVVQAMIYQRYGFTRILGSVHLMWIPMFGWMATRMDSIQIDSELKNWLIVLFLTNIISLLIDFSDMVRFMRGERRPHYYWSVPQSSRLP
jgi:hypothetical protein